MMLMKTLSFNSAQPSQTVNKRVKNVGSITLHIDNLINRIGDTKFLTKTALSSSFHLET